MIRSIIVSVFLLVGTVLSAQIPEGYYDNAIGKTGEELKEALHEIIDDHNEYSYNALRDYILKESDEDPDNSNNVILIYSGISRSKDDFGGNVGDWNREHVWAKSHGDFGNTPPAGTDAHHIRPSDVQVNGIRGNLDFDNGGTPVSGAPGCKVDNDSFEARDEVKGDVARMIFYMATRYEGGSGEPDLEVIDLVNTSPAPEHGKLSTLLEWHTSDPPDEFEENRNEVVFGYQENRNPFIDHPEFVEDIWGDPTSVTNTTEISILVYPNPVADQLTIDCDANSNIQYSLVDLTGRMFLEGDIQNRKLIISLSGRPAGLYLLILTDEAGLQIDQFKLMKTSR